MISPQVIDKILDTAIIEEVVGEYVVLKRSGANYSGLCPFHDDKHPSMSVSPSKGIFKCFSCGKGGNAVQFIMEHEGMTYPLALKFLADKYNIVIDESEMNLGEYEEESRKKDGIYACLEFAKNYYRKKLNESREGQAIYKPYLTERGLREDILERFQVGLSGLDKQEILKAGLQQGYTAQQLFDAGLVKKIEEDQGVLESNLRDTFWERILFPILNISGKVLGFGGRIIKKDTKAPKYLNSPETVVYEKRRELYGLHLAKNSSRKEDHIYVVEGYMDVLSLSQAGIENVVAVSGTAFTEEQSRMLKRFTQNITLLFDGDEAGINASLKHIYTLLKAGLNTRVVLFPDGEDPDSYVQRNSGSGFTQYVNEESKNFVDFIADIKLRERPDDPILRADTARLIAENIALIPDSLKRATFISQATARLKIDEKILIAEINKYRVKTQVIRDKAGSINDHHYFNPEPEAQIIEKDTKNYQEFDLLRSLILYADREFDEEKNIAGFIFSELNEDDVWPESEEYASIFKDAYDHYQNTGTLSEIFFIRHEICCKVAADVIANRYQLSPGWEKNYEKIVPDEEKYYKKKVIENLNYLKLHRIEKAILENNNKLKDINDEADTLIYQKIHLSLQELKKRITDEMGAVVFK